MELLGQILDCDYILIDGSAVVRIFGRTEDNKTFCAFVKGYNPYFYIDPAENGAQSCEYFVRDKFKSQVLNVEAVERFRPMGFNDKPASMLKITMRDPSQVPEVRDALKGQPFVKNIYEADILFKYRFMCDKNLFGMRWYKINGSPVKTATVKADRTIDLESIEPGPEKPFVLSTMSVDIEVASEEGLPDAKKDPIIMISIAFSPSYMEKKSLVLVAKYTKANENTVGFANEEEMLKEFMKIVERYDPDVITGYNINNFDIPYILERLNSNKLQRTMGRCNIKPLMSKKLAGKIKNTMIGRLIVDNYELIKEMQVKTQLADKGFPKLKRYSLSDVSRELLNDDKEDVSHKEIPKLWAGSADDVIRLAEYARKDADLALRLLINKNLLDKFIEISKVSGVLMQDVLDGGESTRVENILLREFNSRNFLLPLKPDENEMLKRAEERDKLGFKGALVLVPEPGLHTKPVVYLDFKSMYPTIFISFNICPTTLVSPGSSYSGDVIDTPLGAKFTSKQTRVGIVPTIVQNLINERDRLRKEAKQTPDDKIRKILESKQIAVKYMTNSFYGYMGYIRARIYSLQVATAITGCGRMLIERARETVNKHNDMKVVYGDTDSIMVQINSPTAEEGYKIGTQLEKEINVALEGLVEIKIENVFRSLLILSKKRYAGLSLEPRGDDWEERIVMKGIETVRRDWCDLTGETLKTVLEIILREQNPKKALTHVKDTMSRMASNQIPIEKLVITKSISKSIKEYKGVQPHIEVMKKMRKRDIATAPGIGDRVGYVIIQGLQMMSERAEDPTFAKSHNLKVDSRYYMENQLLPPLERVFESMGITKSEILGLGKQMSLKDMMTRKPPSQVESLQKPDGVMCSKCNHSYSRPPLVGRCDRCGSELLFYSGETTSKMVSAPLLKV